MFVYVWKDAGAVPFYVGFTNSLRRTNPKNSPKRNWLCEQKLAEVGRDHVVVEIRFVASVSEGQELERLLIKQYGRIQTGSGSLTNLTSGGEGAQPMSAENKEKRRAAMLAPDNPIRSLDAIKKRNAALKTRMNKPDIKEAMTGEKNLAKRPEVRAKLKAIWEDPEYKNARVAEMIGKPKNFSEEDLARRSAALKANSSMKPWGERNGKDPEFDAKRIEGIRASQPARAAKMADPAALAQRKERLKATMNSPEFKAKRALFDTPEYRKKLADAKREYWAKKKLAQSV